MNTNKFYTIICLFFLTMSVNIKAQKTHGCNHCERAFYGEPDSIITIRHKFPFARKKQDISVAVHNGNMVFEGDIVLGHVDDLKNKGLARDSNNWPEGIIPYTISSWIPASQVTAINDAVAHINNNTNLNLIVRTTQTQWVDIIQDSGCYASNIGKPNSGNVTMGLASGCSFGNIVHEFLHVAGLGHEQNRQDRNSFVNINYSNIQPGSVSQFNQQIAGYSDYSAYDYGSIMHYGNFFFAIDPTIETITTIPPGQTIGQRDAMSATDINTINRLYPTCSSSTLSLSGNLFGRYTSGTDISSTGTLAAGNYLVLSANDEIKLLPGAKIEVDATSKAELVLDGCFP